ncbi:hypothetical protein G3I24_23350 [Micromonospora aurantiaca]|nr:hypothetical protein [Micromonospora aurantiaca]
MSAGTSIGALTDDLLHAVCEEPHYRNLTSSIPIWMPLATILPCGRPAADLR